MQTGTPSKNNDDSRVTLSGGLAAASPETKGDTASITNKRIAVLGLGFVGLPLAGTFAKVGFNVTGVDTSERVRKSLNEGKSHFEECGLQELLDRELSNRLKIDGEIRPKEHDIYIIAVGTPVDTNTRKPILDYVKGASETVGKCLKKGDLVVLRSTVPVGTTRHTALPILEKASGLKAGDDFHLVFAAERLIAGKALEELRTLPQIIGGLKGGKDVEIATKLFKMLTPTTIPVENPEAAEMAKIIDNSFRDLRFAYANQMARLSEKIGIDFHKLVPAVNEGYERNSIPLPSPGVGGTCLSKDPYILADFGDRYGYMPPLAKVARDINESMPTHVAEKTMKMLKAVGKDADQATVLVLGFAFKGKPETSDTRDSPTIPVVQTLSQEGCKVIGHDPVVSTDEMTRLGAEPTELEEGFKKADAVIIMTNHEAYASMNIKELLSSTQKPAVFIDGWHLFDPEKMKTIDGVSYGGLGND